ncbi:MAG: four-helix bundle copper-binding protein [Rhodoferax sp.]|nr:four-helix bundle copper-binding protein [Rubrivivax sp.]MBP6505599.1 four-helix bundle copper-binding protein [Rhodoferax sp.]
MDHCRRCGEACKRCEDACLVMAHRPPKVTTRKLP